jgi:nucleoside-diphosphate-sugar epimerase
MAQSVFIAGGTGFLGRHIIPVLLRRGHHVRALVRAGSEHKLPLGCDLVTGSPLDRRTFADQIGDADTYVHLVGVPNPSPAKANQFFKFDLPAAREAIDAAAETRMRHFVFVSVAQPAPIMKAYQQARAQAEGHLALARLNATILRPWYVIGPGRRWPLVLEPLYSLAERVPRWRVAALRLGLVTLEQMVAATVESIEDPPYGTRFLTVPDIRQARLRHH